MRFLKENKFFFIFLFSLSFIYGIIIITPNYLNLPISNTRDFVLIGLHWFYVTFSSFVVIYFLALWKRLFIILFPVFMAISAAMAFYSYKFDITINAAVIGSFFNTNREEAFGLISFQLIIFIAFMILFSVLSSYIRFKKITVKFKAIHILIIFLGIILINMVNTIRYNTLNYRIPFSLFYASKEYMHEAKLMKQDKKDISDGAYTKVDSLTVVFIIGEALRADHLGLNGYERNTTPRLEKEKVISFPNIYSEWTHTNSSLPHILTRADSTNPMPVYEETSFISIFNKSGFYTSWIANQIPNKSFLFYVNECDTSIINKPFHSEYNFSKKLDEDLFPEIHKFITNENPKKLAIIHLLGSHWFYPSHYPDAFNYYEPSIEGKTFNNDDKNKIINAYDNSVRYTDYISAEIINMLKNEKSILIFLSDHGEILGENGKWLHAQNTEFEKNPACFIWFSDWYKKEYPEKVNHSLKNQFSKIRTDFLFHTILEAAEIESSVRDSSFSIL